MNTQVIYVRADVNKEELKKSGIQVKLPDFFFDNGYDTESIYDEAPRFKNPQENDYTVTNEKLLK